MAAFGQSESWDTFDCPGSQRRWRILEDGRIEVEGLGVPMRKWPSAVNDWADIIAQKAAKYVIPAYWIAAIMAFESGGRPGLCARKKDGSCNTREGVGLMAMLTTTASSHAGRRVSVQELLDDYDLQIDLGAKMIADLAAKYRSDYVKVAVSYNAGSVKCAQQTSGSTWNLPKEPCPPTPWGVIMGCLRTSKPINSYCAPSDITTGMFACPNDYPGTAIGTHNAALAEGWTIMGLGSRPDLPPVEGEPLPLPLETPPALAGLGPGGTLLVFGAGAVAGYYGIQYMSSRLKRMKI